MKAGVAGGLVALAVVAAVTSLSAAGTRGRQDPRSPTSLTGVDWRAFTSQGKQAYLNGFLAGAAAAQTARSDSGSAPSAVISRLRSERRLLFPYTPSVYAAQLDDYFWYGDHAATPIVDVMIDINRRMLEPPGR